jgi:hypothetical protein
MSGELVDLKIRERMARTGENYMTAYGRVMDGCGCRLRRSR